MFDMYATSVLQPKNIEWVKPDKVYIDVDNEEGMKPFDLLKGAVDYLHTQIGIKVPTSKELFKKAENLWGELRDKQLTECADRPNVNTQFSLDKPTVVYLTTSDNEIVDIQDLMFEENVEAFKELHQKFIINFTTNNVAKMFFQDGKNGLIKYVCYDKNTNVESNEYTPVVLVEMNFEKSTYKVYYGILIYTKFTFIPSVSCDIDEERLYDFINRFDLEDFLIRAEEKSADLYSAYKEFEKNKTEISARELTALFKKVGYKIEADTEDKLKPVENLVDEVNNKKIQDFYNDFKYVTGENVCDIIKLSDFRKTFRYNKMTILDVLEILSHEYLTYGGCKITAEILGDIVYKLYNSDNSDRSQVKIVEGEHK